MVFLVLLAFLSTGCGDKGEGPPPKTSTDSLKEIAEVYKYLDSAKLSAPGSLRDLEAYIDTLASAWPKLQSGEIVLRYRVGLAKSGPAAKAVLAHEKNVASTGGGVLLRDGTVKEMTAAEFQAAPK